MESYSIDNRFIVEPDKHNIKAKGNPVITASDLMPAQLDVVANGESIEVPDKALLIGDQRHLPQVQNRVIKVVGDEDYGHGHPPPIGLDYR
jgi:hypothetical protein